MQIEIKPATPEDIANLQALSDKAHRVHIPAFAPIAFPDPGAEVQPLMGFSREGLGKHGAYDDEDLEGFDMYAPLIKTDFTFKIDYPLKTAALVTVSGKAQEGGYSAADMIAAVKAAYEGIYQMEDGNTPAPDHVNMGSFLLANRPATKGMFGIWGHGIHDLAIEGIDTFVFEDGSATIDVSIGS